MLCQQELFAGFADPPATYRPQPFWFINHTLDLDEIAAQVGMMHDKGVGGFVYHARHGLGDAFMSPQWLAALRTACAEARRLGMDVWLYDEDNWPSGTAGGRLTAAHPEFRMRYLRYWEVRCEGPTFEALEPEMDDNTIYQVVLAPLTEVGGRLHPVMAEVVDITERFDRANGKLRTAVPDGPHLLGFFFLCPVPEGVTFRNGSYLDTMDEQACQEFVRRCYEPNIPAVQAYLGTTVKGIFTDEPGLMIHDGTFATQGFRPTVTDPFGRLPGYVMAWSRRFSEMFQAWRGYDLRPHLLALVYETGPDDLRVRQDYYQTATEAYVRHYYGALRAFTQTHGLKLIGHTLEEPVRIQARSQGNQHLVLAQYDLPGYDYLAIQAGIATEENPARLLAAQCAYSIAALKGGERIMVEAFGGSGNGATLAERRRHANLMALLGTSLFVPHGFYQSFAGERKSDWPPSEFYQAAFWDHYDAFADYLGRLSMLAHAGQPVAPVVVLSPIHTAYRQLGEEGEIRDHIEVDETFSRLSYDLLIQQRNHIYLDEAHLQQAEVQDGGLWLNSYLGTLPVLIVPDCTVLCDETAAQLQRFVAGGGHILWLGQVPGITTSGQAIPDNAFLGGHNVVLSAYDATAVGAQLDQWLPLAQRVRCDRQVFATWKSYDEARLLLVFNPSDDAEVMAELDLGAERWQVEELDPETGQRAPFSGLSVALTPSQLRAFWLTPDPLALAAPAASAPVVEPAWRTCRASGWERQCDNLLPLDGWHVRLSLPPEERPAGVRWMGHTTVIRYSAHFGVRDLPPALWLLLDDLPQYIPAHYGVLTGYRDLEVAVNGQLVPPLATVDYPDHYFTGVDITPYLRVGQNEIALYVAQSNERPAAPTLQYPPMLRGDFALDGDGALVAVGNGEPGYWDERGAPYYSGVVSYTYEVTLTKDAPALWLDLGEVHESARIVVNGLVSATRLWPPYTLKVPAYWREGVNTVVVQVANTAANLWEKRRRRSGMAGVLRYALVE
jgi:hypothetical protein